jgi:cation diffusion facilitator family transporter
VTSKSLGSVIVAILANLIVAAAKIFAATMTGSAAMVSEAIHSLVDTGNETLMLVGIARSRKPPDAAHSFGYSRELYFWTLVVAIVLFGIGGGMSTIEGINRILHPSPIGNPTWNYVVLGFSAIFEAISWTVSYRALRDALPALSIVQAVRTSKDPTVFTVLLEDSAALTGIAIAFAGTYLAHALHNEFFDGAASVLIGLVLVVAGAFLIAETRGLLIGESAEPEMVRRIRGIAQAERGVDRVERALTMYMGPNDVLLNLDLRFARGLSGAEVAGATDRVVKAVKSAYPQIQRIFIEAQALEETGL